MLCEQLAQSVQLLRGKIGIEMSKLRLKPRPEGQKLLRHLLTHLGGVVVQEPQKIGDLVLVNHKRWGFVF